MLGKSVALAGEAHFWDPPSDTLLPSPRPHSHSPAFYERPAASPSPLGPPRPPPLLNDPNKGPFPPSVS